MADSAQDRNLPASQRKLQKARAEGQVARSRDLGHLGAVGGGVALLAMLAPTLTGWLQNLLAQGLRLPPQVVRRPELMGERLQQLALEMVGALLPMFGATAAAALAGVVLVGGWNFTLKPMAPNFGKLNPLSGLSRVVSLNQLTDTLKACLLAVLLGSAGAAVLAGQWTRHAELLAMPLPAALAAGGALLQGGLWVLCGVLAVFALVDVPLQRQMHLRRQRMTAQEQKQEHKEQEGNAEVKGRMRAKMREMANRRMMANVPLADLVVMNPSHYAVALKYDEAAMGAPRVVAKGADLVAMRIRDLARESKVPVLQSPPLARALYAHTEVDQEVPARLFTAVAQVLAWVYAVRDAVAAGRAAQVPPPPVPEVPADMDPLNKPRAGADA